MGGQLTQSTKRHCLLRDEEVVLTQYLYLEKGASCAIELSDEESFCSQQESCLYYKKGNKECFLLKAEG